MWRKSLGPVSVGWWVCRRELQGEGGLTHLRSLGPGKEERRVTIVETALEGLTWRTEERAAARGWERDMSAPPAGPGSEGRPCLSSPRLSHTKAAVKAALADDFDTPGAVDAVMDLIHQGNRQLKVVTKVTLGTWPQSRVFVSLVLPHKEQMPPSRLPWVPSPPIAGGFQASPKFPKLLHPKCGLPVGPARDSHFPEPRAVATGTVRPSTLAVSTHVC